MRKYMLIFKTKSQVEADVTATLTGDNGVLACGSIHGSIKD